MLISEHSICFYLHGYFVIIINKNNIIDTYFSTVDDDDDDCVGGGLTSTFDAAELSAGSAGPVGTLLIFFIYLLSKKNK